MRVRTASKSLPETRARSTDLQAQPPPFHPWGLPCPTQQGQGPTPGNCGLCTCLGIGPGSMGREKEVGVGRGGDTNGSVSPGPKSEADVRQEALSWCGWFLAWRLCGYQGRGLPPNQRAPTSCIPLGPAQRAGRGAEPSDQAGKWAYLNEKGQRKMSFKIVFRNVKPRGRKGAHSTLWATLTLSPQISQVDRRTPFITNLHLRAPKGT